MPSGEALQGRLHKLYIDPAGDMTTPTWTEYGKIQGGGQTSGRDVSELKERDTDETTVLLGHRNNEQSLTITRRHGNTQFDALRTAHINGSKISIAMMTGTITDSGERGYQAEMYVTQFDDDQSHESNSISVTLRPAADYVVAPGYVTIA